MNVANVGSAIKIAADANECELVGGAFGVVSRVGEGGCYDVLLYGVSGTPKRLVSGVSRDQFEILEGEGSRESEVEIYNALTKSTTALHIRCLASDAEAKVRMFLSELGATGIIKVKDDLLVCPVPSAMTGKLALALIEKGVVDAHHRLSLIESGGWFERFLGDVPYSATIREMSSDSPALYGHAPLSTMSLPPIRLSEEVLASFLDVPSPSVQAERLSGVVVKHFEPEGAGDLRSSIEVMMRWVDEQLVAIDEPLAVPEFPFFQVISILTTALKNSAQDRPVYERVLETIAPISRYIEDEVPMIGKVDAVKTAMGVAPRLVRFTYSAKSAVASGTKEMDVEAPPFSAEVCLTEVDSQAVRWFVDELMLSVDLSNVTANDVLLDLILWIRIRDYAANAYARFYLAINELAEAMATPSPQTSVAINKILKALVMEGDDLSC